MKKILAMACLMLLLAALPGAEIQAEAVDLTRMGSITLNLTDQQGRPACGGEYWLFRVGEPVIRQSQLTFDLAPAFAGSGVSLSDPSASHVAGLLVWYVQNQSLSPMQRQMADAKGRAVFTNVPCGLYLVMQKEPDKTYGYERMSSFVVSVPMTSGQKWKYDISATPKVQKKPTSSGGSTPTGSPKPTATKSPYDSKLPQTGMLLWPIPVLAGAGMGLFILGWVLCFGRKRHDKA